MHHDPELVLPNYTAATLTMSPISLLARFFIIYYRVSLNRTHLSHHSSSICKKCERSARSCTGLYCNAAEQTPFKPSAIDVKVDDECYVGFQEALKKKQQPPSSTPSSVSAPFVATAPAAATPLAAAAPTVPSLPASPQAHSDVRPHFSYHPSIIALPMPGPSNLPASVSTTAKRVLSVG